MINTLNSNLENINDADKNVNIFQNRRKSSFNKDSHVMESLMKKNKKKKSKSKKSNKGSGNANKNFESSNNVAGKKSLNTANASNTGHGVGSTGLTNIANRIEKIKNAMGIIKKYASSLTINKNTISVGLGNNMPDELKGANMSILLKGGVYKIVFSNFHSTAQELQAQKFLEIHASEITSSIKNIPNTIGVEISVNKTAVSKSKIPNTENTSKGKKQQNNHDGNSGGKGSQGGKR